MDYDIGIRLDNLSFKLDQVHQKIDAILTKLYPQEQKQINT